MPPGPRNKSSDSDGSRSVKDRASAYMSDNPAFADLEAKIRRSSDGPKQNQPPRRSDSREIYHVSEVLGTELRFGVRTFSYLSFLLCMSFMFLSYLSFFYLQSAHKDSKSIWYSIVCTLINFSFVTSHVIP